MRSWASRRKVGDSAKWYAGSPPYASSAIAFASRMSSVIEDVSGETTITSDGLTSRLGPVQLACTNACRQATARVNRNNSCALSSSTVDAERLNKESNG